VKSNIQQSDVFKALAHNKRLNIVYLLSESELSVGEIQRKLNLPQSNISQHLKALRNAKIVNTRKVGKYVHYSLSHESFSEASKLINEIYK
jgi:ArsR family transcriptional regulator